MTSTPSGRRYLSPKALPAHEEEHVRIIRDEENLAEHALLEGHLVYVRAPRKSGKSSLAARLARRLGAGEAGAGRRIVAPLRLRGIGQNDPGTAFLKALQDRQAEDFGILAGKAGLTTARSDAIRRESGEGIDWFWVAAAAVAREADAPLVVFVDEIENLLERHRAVGELWLIALRDIHQQSGGALTACILGRLPAQFLVRSPELTPFNTAHEIALRNFSEVEIRRMAEEMGAVFDGRPMADVLGRAIYRQTAGQPNQTQCLLRVLSEAYDEDPASIGDFNDLIDDFVLNHAECQPSTSNTFMDIEATFTRPSVWPSRLALEAYANMLDGVPTGSKADPAIVHDPWNEGHQMLEAVGLAQIEAREEGRFLVARSRIARRMFSLEWAKPRLTGLGGAAAAAEGEASEALKRMERVAVEDLCHTEWAINHKASVVPGSGREVVEGALFEFVLVREKPAERLTLQMFRGIGDFGKQLWLRQVRTLRHLSGRAGALPNIHRGGLLDGDQVAYIITQRPELTLADPGFHDHVRKNRGWAMEQFIALTEGLTTMASEGISHRNIWPGSIRTDQPDEHAPAPPMRLANFEFSVMLRSMLSAGADPAARAQERRTALRKAFLRQPPAARPFAAPELLAGLFQEDAPLPSQVTSDVFSLGLVAASWFLDPPDQAAFAAVLPQTSADQATYDLMAHIAYIEGLSGDIERAIHARRLPAALGRVLQDMIVPDPNSRLRPAEVLQRLKESPALAAWATGHRRPFLACYSYLEMGQELARRGAITSPLGTEASQIEVENYLEAALAGAELYHAPRGLAPFVTDPDEEQFAAQWVLKGSAWLFYCQRFERRVGGFGGVRAQADHILRLAYAWPINRAWGSVPRQTVPLRAFGPLTLVEQRGSPEMGAENDSKYRPWDPILGAARRMAMAPSFEIAQTGFNWLVDAQRQELAMQRFPIRAVSEGPAPGGGRERTYEFDEKAYREHVDRSRMRSAIHRSGFFGDHRDRFEQVLQEAHAGDRLVRIQPYTESSTGAPEGSSDRRGTMAVLTSVSGTTVSVRGRSLPTPAWIDLDDASLARRPIDQQADAVQALAGNPALFDQLLEPYVVVDDETVSENALSASVEGLAGRAGEIVRKIVTSSPLTALQGPPGTGKTTVIAAVVQTLLNTDQTNRILVTSQSHAAVDNIAQRIMDLGLAADDQIICTRVASDEAFKSGGAVAESIAAWRPEAVAERLAERIRKACIEKLEGTLGGDLRAAYEQLAHAAQDGALELTERVRESAAVVFATTAGSRRVADEGYLRPGGRFDLTVVDEASKAHPTEIIQPMLLAERQLLVGDHRQLPAFGSTSIRNLLQECAGSPHEEFRVLEQNRTAIEAWLKLFASFFQPGNDKYVAAFEQERLHGWRDNKKVVEQLDLQFRMRSSIADVISYSFYDDKLDSAAGVDDREGPAWLDAFVDELDVPKGIVWVDTRADQHFTSADPVVNEDQAKLAARLLVRAHRLGAGADGRLGAVVLSPYKAQNRAIEKQLAAIGYPELATAVRSVDSFQGQEAELVILSLTRSPRAGEREGGRATSRYGFMVSPERVNVMFSRARELLVVLGDFDFFAAANKVERQVSPMAPMDLRFWEKLCHRIERTGRITDNSSLPPNVRV